MRLKHQLKHFFLHWFLLFLASCFFCCSGSVSLGQGQEDADTEGDVDSECSEGACCQDGSYLPDTHVCESSTEYQCEGDGCGGEAQQRTIDHYCSGTSPECDGEIIEEEWLTTDRCSENQICQSSDENSFCQDCPSGCTDGGCNDPTVQMVAGGGQHTCALLTNGAVRCWGDNGSGQLGYGNTLTIIGDDETPFSAGDVDVGGRATQIATGSKHTCALLEDGSVRCWGLGYSGQTGRGDQETIGDDETPSSAGDVDVGGEVIQISAGEGHTCALLETGSVRCWGSARYGQLGYGNTQDIGDNEHPSSAGDVDVGGTVIQISCGNYHTCALLDTGSVRCWGIGDSGPLGYADSGHIGDNEHPSSAGDVDVGGTVEQIVAGGQHTCALLDTGSVRCWGFNQFGQLGYGHRNNVGDNENPSDAGDVDVGASVAQLTAGTYHTCVLLTSGSVKCWGFGDGGRLGYGNGDWVGYENHPSSVGNIDLGGTAVQINAGRNHTCAVLASGNLRCWGFNHWGQLGLGNSRNRLGDDELPSSVGDIDIGGHVVELSSGHNHNCVLLDTGAVRCWGIGGNGNLGYGNPEMIGDDEVPSSTGDVDTGGLVEHIFAGGVHTCAMLESGSARCWGHGSYGQLGYGNRHDIGDDEHPSSVNVVDTGSSVDHFALGAHHTCALLDGGAARCWGRGDYGQLGHGDISKLGTNEVPSEIDDIDVGGTIVQIAAGDYHSCAILDTGSVRCWGANWAGQLGYGNYDYIGDDEYPSSAGEVDVGSTVVQIATGGNHTCILTDEETVRCWGSGLLGQLGYGNTDVIGDDEFPSSAGDVDVGGSVVQVVAGESHTCGLLDGGTVRCWGSSEHGQLGYGNIENIGDDELPSSAGDVNVGASVVQISAGQSHTCALTENGSVRCWGRGTFGQLGRFYTNTIGDDETPASAGDVPVLE